MRVLFWSETFWPAIGGPQVFSAELLPALRARGHEIAVVTAKENAQLPAESTWNGFPVHRLAVRDAIEGGADAVMALRARVAALKRSFRPHLVHLNAIAPSVLFHLATEHAHAAPLLLTLHSMLEGKSVTAETVGGQVLRSAAWVACCAQAVHAAVAARLPAIGDRSSVVYCGLAMPCLAPTARPTEPRVLCVGRAVALKGFDLALEAFARLRREVPPVRLVLAGDGPESAALRRQADALGVADAVDFRGWVAPQDVPQLIDAASVVLVPSRREVLPLIAVQAAQRARPVVATDVGAMREVVAPGRTGLLVAPGDPEALAAALARVLADPVASAAMGTAAHRAVRRRFSARRCAVAYDRLYRRLTQEVIHVASA